MIDLKEIYLANKKAETLTYDKLETLLQLALNQIDDLKRKE